jgi:hypothetical protein
VSRPGIFHRSVTANALGIVCATVLGAQATPARLEIVRDAGPPLVISASDLAAMPHQTVQGSDHGKMISFSAVPLLALLRQAGVAVDSVRGPLVSSIVVASATDGYRVTFSLGELAPDLGRTVVYVADARDGAPLAASEGPFRLVVPNDQRPGRWVRQVVRIAVRRVDP